MKRIASLILIFIFLTGCAYNPMIANNRTTGSAAGTMTGAAIGAGTVGLLGGSKALMAAAGLGGGMLGYYLTTLRHDASGILQANGQVYRLGDFVGIVIPSDNLFEPNSAEFLPQAAPILDSAVTVLKRYPKNNIIISGNNSGFYRSAWGQRISERRAQQVAAYLWNAGIPNRNEMCRGTYCRLSYEYVGYGDYFPIANDYTNDGIRANSRIQIISYPSDCRLEVKKKLTLFKQTPRPYKGLSCIANQACQQH